MIDNINNINNSNSDPDPDYKKIMTDAFAALGPGVTADDIIRAKSGAAPQRSRKPLWITLGALGAAAAAAFFIMIGVGYDRTHPHGNSNIALGEEKIKPVLLDGLYYLNGDVSTGLYAEVKDGEMRFCGDRDAYARLVYEYMLPSYIASVGHEPSAEEEELIMRSAYEDIDARFLSSSGDYPGGLYIQDFNFPDNALVTDGFNGQLDGKQYYHIYKNALALRFDGKDTINVFGALSQEKLDSCATEEERIKCFKGLGDFILVRDE